MLLEVQLLFVSCFCFSSQLVSFLVLFAFFLVQLLLQLFQPFQWFITSFEVRFSKREVILVNRSETNDVQKPSFRILEMHNPGTKLHETDISSDTSIFKVNAKLKNVFRFIWKENLSGGTGIAFSKKYSWNLILIITFLYALLTWCTRMLNCTISRFQFNHNSSKLLTVLLYAVRNF